MYETISSFPATQFQKRLAALTACALLAAFVVVFPHSSEPLAQVPAFIAIFATFVILTDTLTAHFLFWNFVQGRRTSTGLIASAYLYSALIAFTQLLIFPGTLSINIGPSASESAVWLWIFWHAGFPSFLILAVLARGRAAHTRRSFRGTLALVLALPVVLAAAAASAAIGLPESLHAMTRGNSYADLMRTGVGEAIIALNLLGVIALVRRTRLTSVLYLWLTVAALAFTLDVVLTLFAGARYSAGWYAARMISMVSSTIVLSALLAEINQLYGQVARANVKLKDAAEHDALTGVYNRRYFDAELERACARSRREGESIAIALLDIDHFKSFNDQYGHPAGDVCLQRVAKAIESQVRRAGEFVARIGGEEFAIVMPGCDVRGAIASAERVREAIAGLAIPAAAKASSAIVTASLGVSVNDGSSPLDATALLKSADRALYRAKHAGRNAARTDIGVVPEDQVA